MFNLFSLNFAVSTNLNVGHQFVIKCFRIVSVFKSRLDSFGAFLSGLKLGEGAEQYIGKQQEGAGQLVQLFTLYCSLFTVGRTVHFTVPNSVLNTV